jgi:hypothetical protein
MVRAGKTLYPFIIYPFIIPQLDYPFPKQTERK